MQTKDTSLTEQELRKSVSDILKKGNFPVMYILKDKVAVECDDVIEWGQWMSAIPNNKRVGMTEMNQYKVSTVFLGTPHGFSKSMRALFFETMVFDDGKDIYCKRSSTWDKAEAQHKKAIGFVLDKISKESE